MALATSSPPRPIHLSGWQRDSSWVSFFLRSGVVADLLSMATTYFDQPERADEMPQRVEHVESTAVTQFIADHLDLDDNATVIVVPEESSEAPT